MKLTWWERFTFTFAPAWTVRRAAMRTALRNFEAASSSRRTAGWTRNRGDANSVIARAGAELRVLARDLMRNNAWARRARNVVVHNIVGWGAMPTPAVEDRALASRQQQQRRHQQDGFQPVRNGKELLQHQGPLP